MSDFRSPESAYCSKPNIVVPKTDMRTAAAIAVVAAQTEELDNQDVPKTHSRASNVITGTYVSPTKEP